MRNPISMIQPGNQCPFRPTGSWAGSIITVSPGFDMNFATAGAESSLTSISKEWIISPMCILMEST
jgi:hypothetical protein